MLVDSEQKCLPAYAYTDVFQVWGEILEKRPKIVKQTAKVYAKRPHGVTPVQQTEVLPIERILWSDNSSSFFGQAGDIKAIGASVELRPDDYDPTINYSGSYRWFCEGDSLVIDRKHSKSFIFLDFESEPSNELLNLTIKTLKSWNSDWYLFDSGGSFHLVIDKLVDHKELPIFYGQLIVDMSKYLPNVKRELYSHIGQYLIENADDVQKLKLWVLDILEKIGHHDERSDKAKLVFPIDLRYIAHVLGGLIREDNNEGYLRVSEKHGSVPVLIAKQIKCKVITYQPADLIFNRKQLRLPNF